PQASPATLSATGRRPTCARPDEETSMTRMLYRLGAACAAHPWRVLMTWAVLVATAVGLATTAGGTPRDDWNVPGLEAQAGTDLLRTQFPEAAGAMDRVVVHDPAGDPVPDQAVAALTAR